MPGPGPARFDRARPVRVLRRSGLVRAAPARVFAVLEDVRLADQVLPPFLHVTAIETPWLPRPGSRSRLRATYRETGFDLEMTLAEYRDGSFLLERQVSGPFAAFEHAVSVEPAVIGTGDGPPGPPIATVPDHSGVPAHSGAPDAVPGTRVTEVLAYSVVLGPLGRLFDALVLRRDLERVLDVRLARLRDLLERG